MVSTETSNKPKERQRGASETDTGNEPLERAILGAVLSTRAAAEEALPRLEVAFFESAAHKKIFVLCKELFDRGCPCDLPAALAATARCSFDVDAQYLAELCGAQFDAANVSGYVDELIRRIGPALLAEAHRMVSDDLARTDPSQFEAKAAETDGAIAKAKSRLYRIDDAGFERSFARMVGEIRSSAKAGVEPDRVKTGLSKIDRRLHGLRPGRYYVIAGRPGMGKSALAMTILLNAARASKRVGLFSLEMTEEDVWQRLICSHGGIEGDKLDQPWTMTVPDMQAFERSVSEVKELSRFIRMDISHENSFAGLQAKASAWHNQQPLDLLIVDYLQLLRTGRESRYAEVGEISGGLRNMALRMKIPIIVLSQLSRAVEARQNKRPILSDLKESGDIEQDADVVLLLYRESYYTDRFSPNAKSHGVAQEEVEICAAKVRAGKTGVDTVGFQPGYTRFVDLSPRCGEAS